MSQQPGDAGTVQVRVQVIDLEPFALDLVVPTYLPTRDLTTRIARDAGLGAYWEDGTRRSFYLRARGRLLTDDERLDSLGIVHNELLHLLPQPPIGSGVMERAPEYPPNKGYAGAGWLNVINSLFFLLLWTTGWGIALTVSHTGVFGNILTGVLPALGLSLLSVTFSRHLWGGPGKAVKIPIVGLVIYFSLLVMAGVPAVLIAHATPQELATSLVPAALSGIFGVILGWLAWYGAVEPLPKILPQHQQKGPLVVQTVPCGICGLPVTPDVKADCKYACGRSFHVGCYKARESVNRTDACSVCGYRPA